MPECCGRECEFCTGNMANTHVTRELSKGGRGVGAHNTRVHPHSCARAVCFQCACVVLLYPPSYMCRLVLACSSCLFLGEGGVREGVKNNPSEFACCLAEVIGSEHGSATGRQEIGRGVVSGGRAEADAILTCVTRQSLHGRALDADGWDPRGPATRQLSVRKTCPVWWAGVGGIKEKQKGVRKRDVACTRAGRLPQPHCCIQPDVHPAVVLF